MARVLLSAGAALLQRAYITADGCVGRHSTAGLLSRCFGAAAAAQGGGGCRRLLAQQASGAGPARLTHSTAAAAAASTATAARGGGDLAAAAAAAAAAGVPWRAVGAAASRQQARGFARYLQFQPRNSGGGWGSGRSWGGMFSDPDKVVWGLIGANVAGFVAWRVWPHGMHTHATVSIEGLRAGRLWTVVTAAFSHQDLMHLGSNMLGLFFFGRDIGRLFGGKKLLALYLAGATVGSLAHCGWYFYQACKTGEGRFGRTRWFGFTPSAMGASAAVNAVMLVDILLFPTRTILLYGFIPMPAALLGALWLYQDVSGTLGGHSHIAHAGHLGGAATGLAFWLAHKRGLIRPRGW